ncbi:MAG: ribonuclease III [Planctomycetota bacterium]|jgi:ribonuclease-3
MLRLESETLDKAQKILGYCFNNVELLSEALTHASVAEERVRSNERLEFLGDAILDAIVCEYLFYTYPEYLEGDLTKIKSAVVSRKTCARLSDDLGITPLLCLGKGMGGPGNLPQSLAAAVYESVVAAIYLDGGFEPVKEFVMGHIVPVITAIEASAHQHNFKSVLQQYAQKNLDQLPQYRLLDEKGPDHSKCFHMAVEVNGQSYAGEWGQNKKQAEQDAALIALKEMGLVREDEDGHIIMDEKLTG